MFIEVSNFELANILENGSTNQKQFIKDIEASNNNVIEVLDFIEDNMSEITEDIFDIRSFLNGGALRFEELTEEIKENYFYLEFNNNYGVVFY